MEVSVDHLLALIGRQHVEISLLQQQLAQQAQALQQAHEKWMLAEAKAPPPPKDESA